MQTHVRLSRARGSGGVDLPNVVADLVRPQLGQLGARAEPGGTAVARQRSRGPLGRHEIERLEQPLRHVPRALAGRGRLERARAHAAAIPGSRSMFVRGSGTAASTRSSSSSAVTLSASAS